MNTDKHHEHGLANPEQDSEELHLSKVITAFAYYKRHSLNQNYRKRRDYFALPKAHQDFIQDHLEKLNKVDKLIEANALFLDDIAKGADTFMALERLKDNKDYHVSPMEMDKVKSTLKQFVRDWSKEGEEERNATYKPIIKELNEIYKSMPTEERGAVRVLVPGAGLGRLAFDIAKEGFTCQGNEFSYYMLFASDFVLNRMEKAGEYEIYPFIHSFSNIKSEEKQLAPVLIPDVLPANLLDTVDFSMVAGDFIEVYSSDSNKGSWDVIVTCFFMDTAKNIIEYMEVIKKALKENGTWINIGPLLYHFEDSTTEDSSIELSLEKVKQVARKMGFSFKKESTVLTTYTSNPDGMLKYVYECAFWTAVKDPSS